MDPIFLIVGLGNPGDEYAGTRHNIGFLAVEELARRCQAKWSMENRFESRLARTDLEGRKLLLCEPQTYMNLSGTAVHALVSYFKIELARLLVVVDDADLPFGELRLRPKGTSGGHHGLESIEQHLATREYARLRLGIGREPNAPREITNHVLGRFKSAEKKQLPEICARAADLLDCWITEGIQKAMSAFNGAFQPPLPKES